MNDGGTGEQTEEASLEEKNRAMELPHVEGSIPSKTLPSSNSEIAVRVDIAAGPFGYHRLCGHIIGRHCLGKHVKSKGHWRNQCPLCRQVWFPRVQSPPFPLATPRRISRNPFTGILRICDRVIDPRIRAAEAAASGDMDHGTAFMQRVMQEFPAKNDMDEIEGSLENIERRLRRLYEM